MNWIFSIYLRLNKSGNQTTKWCPRSQGAIMGSWPRHCSVCDLLPIRALPCLFLLLGLLCARGQPEEMEIHFEAPFHKRFVNLCVLTMKRVKLLIKTPMLTHPFIAWSEMKKKKIKSKWILVLLETKWSPFIHSWNSNCSGLGSSLLHYNGNDFLISPHLQRGTQGSDYDLNVAFHHPKLAKAEPQRFKVWLWSFDWSPRSVGALVFPLSADYSQHHLCFQMFALFISSAQTSSTAGN